MKWILSNLLAISLLQHSITELLGLSVPSQRSLSAGSGFIKVIRKLKSDTLSLPLDQFVTAACPVCLPAQQWNTLKHRPACSSSVLCHMRSKHVHTLLECLLQWITAWMRKTHIYSIYNLQWGSNIWDY